MKRSMFLERAGRPAGATGAPVVPYKLGDKARVITPGSQYYGSEGKVVSVGPNLIIVTVKNDTVAYEPREIRRVK